jgi:hypothetical protein
MDASTGYAVGGGLDVGTILKTVNGGASWTSQTSGTTNAYFSVFFPVDALTGYVVGSNNTILKTTDGGESLTDVAEEMPTAGSQGLAVRSIAAPNPFGEQTRISYQLSAPSLVSLSIYNIAGQAVRVLVRERKQAGAHQAVWDGRDQRGRKMPASVYLIRLEAEGRVVTGRVVLIR